MLRRRTTSHILSNTSVKTCKSKNMWRCPSMHLGLKGAASSAELALIKCCLRDLCDCGHFWQSVSLSLQMSNYKRATFEEEEVSDGPAEASLSPDGVEVSEWTDRVRVQVHRQPWVSPWGENGKAEETRRTLNRQHAVVRDKDIYWTIMVLGWTGISWV